MVKIDQLRKAYYAAARIVQVLGDEYLVFFDRIHRELIEAEKIHSLKSLAMNVAKNCKQYE